MLKRSITSRQGATKSIKPIISASIESSAAPASSQVLLSFLQQKRLLIFGLAAIIAIGGIAFAAYKLLPKSSSTDLAGIKLREGVDPKEISGVISRVRESVYVSSDEVPTVASIQDVDLLRPQNPSLYRDAQNGDKLLVWSDKVVVFSSTKDRVLVVMPINTDNQVAAGQNSVQEKSSLSIEVRNGSTKAGAAKVLSEQLKTDGFSLINPNDASRKNFPATLVYNFSGKASSEFLTELVRITGGKVVDKVEGERPTNADVLIILGGE